MKQVLPILLAAGLAGAPALADPSPLPPGCWTGAVKDGEGKSQFAVQLWSAPPAGQLHLSSPKKCFYKLGDKGDGKTYSLAAQSCTELDQTELSVKPDGTGYIVTIVKLGVAATLTRDATLTDKESCHIS